MGGVYCGQYSVQGAQQSLWTYEGVSLTHSQHTQMLCIKHRGLAQDKDNMEHYMDKIFWKQSRQWKGHLDIGEFSK